ncbi:DUF1758 domain-containing protein [Trichonephila clavata]|uniref:DUF1758 domain-containing protein n=1 Tax=Trichonephila clavata TaxID=2740835 RepID=A0A8X6JI29_TRICU|nr:DUF1758 domain-containing protein [Trichonephila clavata]
MAGQRARSPTTKNCAPQATAVCGCGERQPSEVQWMVSARGSLLRDQGIPSARCSNFLNTFQLPNDENAVLIKLDNKLSTIKEIIKEINELKQSYCDLPEQVDLKDALEITMDLEETQELEVSLHIILCQFKKENAKNDNQITKNNIRLPDLSLPTFSGKFQVFELFKNQFMNVIGNNSSLNDTQKLCYLKSALKNDASLIQSDQDSFESLMYALRNRYENKRALVDIPISEILSVPKIQSWNTLDKTLCSFWETENISEEQPIISDELSYCENIFERTHFRKPCGRYSVSLPFKENIQENVNLGDSRSIASKRLDQLWKRLDRDPKLKNLYTQFIDEYLSLDHKEEITNMDDLTSEEGFFLPHHTAC